jgi:DHA2 family multidrug resistance protein
VASIPSSGAWRDTTEYGWRRWIIVFGILMAPLMETIDSTIVNVALPTVQGNLGATLAQAAWVVTGYLVANVIVIPLTPWLQTRFGRRQYFTATIIGFTIASVLCAISTSMPELVLFRVIQGLFGGGLIATAQATLRDIFPPSEVGTSQGAFAIAILVGPIVAPMLGGIIIDALSWQWIFYINIVPGAISAIIAATMLRNPTDPKASSVDVLGIALLATTLGGLQYVLDEGERNDWFDSAAIVCSALASAIGFVSFILWELFGTRSPIVDLRVLRYRSVAVGALLAAGIAATMFGTVLVLPQYAQTVLGFTAFGSGELTFFRAIPVMLLVPAVVAIVSRGGVDARIVMGIGYVLTASGSLLLAHATTSITAFWQLVPGLIIGGIGTAMLMIPLLISVQSAASPEDAPKASSFVTLAFQLGGSVASAILVTILDRRAHFHFDVMAAQITTASPTVRDALHHVVPSQLVSMVALQAQTLAFADVAVIVASLALLLVPLLILMRRQRALKEVSFE